MCHGGKRFCPFGPTAAILRPPPMSKINVSRISFLETVRIIALPPPKCNRKPHFALRALKSAKQSTVQSAELRNLQAASETCETSATRGTRGTSFFAENGKAQRSLPLALLLRPSSNASNLAIGQRQSHCPCHQYSAKFHTSCLAKGKLLAFTTSHASHASHSSHWQSASREAPPQAKPPHLSDSPVAPNRFSCSTQAIFLYRLFNSPVGAKRFSCTTSGGGLQ